MDSAKIGESSKCGNFSEASTKQGRKELKRLGKKDVPSRTF